MINFNALKLEYGKTMDDDDFMFAIKDAIYNLTEAEQRIFLLYVDTESYSEVARQLHCSAPTAKTYITKVRDKIIDKLEEYDIH